MLNQPESIPSEILDMLNTSNENAFDKNIRKINFFSEILKFADRIGLTDSQVYNAIGMNRSLWYRMRNDSEARTKKENVLKLVIVLRLNFWEAFYLIALAGYSFLPGINETDEIVAQCLLEKIYNPEEVDKILYGKCYKTLFTEE